MPNLLSLLKNRDDSSVIVERINEHPDEINTLGEDGLCPLQVAAVHNRVDIVKALLLAGADNDGMTPLLLAVYAGHLGVVQVLLDHGADPGQADTNGAIALLVAAQNGHVDVVRFFLGIGVNPDDASIDGATALLVAAQNGHVDVVRVLLAHGANPDEVAASDGATALLISAQNGHVDIVRVLLERGANTGDADIDGATALFVAAQNGYVDVVQVLLEHDGAYIDHARDDGATALLVAAQNGYVDVVQVLLRAGANINLTWCERTSLEQAAHNGHEEIVKLLARHPDTTCEMLACLIHGDFSDEIKEALQECVEERLTLADEIGLSIEAPDLIDRFYRSAFFGRTAFGDDFISDRAKTVARQITSEIEAILRYPRSLSIREFSGIKPLFRVHEANLSTIIAKLESQNTGESLFACALLLLGYIKNEVNDRTREAQQDNDTSRKLSAICFLNKAARIKPELTELIRGVLALLKEEVRDNPRVSAYLESFDVNPRDPWPKLARSYCTLFPPSERQETIVSVPRPMPPSSSI